MENILKHNAPVYFGNVDGCVVEWYDGKLYIYLYHFVIIKLLNIINNIFTILAKYNTVIDITPADKSSNYECKYGDYSLSLGQQLTVKEQTDSDTYNTTCSCNIPPFVTCVKVPK